MVALGMGSENSEHFTMKKNVISDLFYIGLKNSRLKNTSDISAFTPGISKTRG